MSFNYFMPTRILFGKGQLLNLHKQALPGKRALIVTSAGTSMKKHGYLSRLEEQLSKANIEYVLFDKILSNPIKAHVMEGAQLARDNRCDFVIGLGGGSSIDSSKAIAIMATNEGDYWDFLTRGSGKNKPVENDPLPIVAITTTAGTGTEADPWAVITNEENNQKSGFGYDKTFPVLSIVDPDLMMTVPAHLTAYQGFDALFHSTEGYINVKANEMSDMYAIKAIELIGRYLTTAVNNGSNEEARAKVALANTLSGMVEWISGCTSEHSMEHALSAFYPDLPHGAGLIMISEAYYTFLAKSGTCDQKFIDMAKALGKTDAKDPMDFVNCLIELQKACGVHRLKMSDYGIKTDEFEKFAENAKYSMGNLFKCDPIELLHEDVVNIYRKSFI